MVVHWYSSSALVLFDSARTATIRAAPVPQEGQRYGFVNIAVVTGMIATYNLGGVVWDYGQYLLGLEALGFDVYYLEDTGGEAYDPRVGDYGRDYSYGVEFTRSELARLSPSLATRWHVLDMEGQSHGMSRADLIEVVHEADVFLNVSGAALVRQEYVPSRRKVLIDTDPGWNHFRNYRLWDLQEKPWYGTAGWRAHDWYFTYAERMGRAGCDIPAMGVDWKATRPPVMLDRWQSEPPATTWTTVMTWDNFRQPIEHEGKIYGTKELEFPKVEALPGATHARLEVATGSNQAPVERWRSLGWSVVDSLSVSRDAQAYRRYIQQSRGEFSVAKNIYVATGSGWFSCRSACYLAAGRPVVVQDTGFSEILPTGLGLLAFRTFEEARQALESVEADYETHQEAARSLARDHLRAETVIQHLLDQIGVT